MHLGAERVMNLIGKTLQVDRSLITRKMRRCQEQMTSFRAPHFQGQYTPRDESPYRQACGSWAGVGWH